MKDNHLKVFGFTAPKGAPVICALIFAAKELELVSWVQNLALLWNGMTMKTTSN